MRFDLTDLRLFLNVHETGTITSGARACHMTLASASERIRAMEDTLGAALLVRDRRGARVTPAGLTLLHHARLVLQEVDRMRDALGHCGTGLRGHVRLFCNTSALSEHLPDAISGFLAQHPGLSIDLEEHTSEDIANAIRHRSCDIGLLSDSVDLEGLEHVLFRADPLVLVVPREHAVAQRRQVALADVIDQPFVGLSEGSALNDHVAQHARRLGRRMHYRVRLRSFEAICRVVGHGIGIGIVPRKVAVRQARSAGVKAIGLSDGWASRNLVLCAQRIADMPDHVRAFLQHVMSQAPRR